MIELPENFDSIFRYIEVVSQRAEQIIKGARPRTESQAVKPILQARDDVDHGLVEWRVLTQEELDAQRQAMVEQFRAEMESVEEIGEGPTTPDVLPTAAAETPPSETIVAETDEEADDELARLQRLLGMAGVAVPSDEADAETGGEAVESEAALDDDGVNEED